MSPFGEGMRRLAARDYAQGWPLYQARRQFQNPPPPEPIAGFPEWQGEDVSGKVVIVLAEQGFGDQLMFGRYLPLLQTRCAAVVVMCHPLIAPVFAAAGYATAPFYVDRPIFPGHVWTHIGSLPLRLGGGPPPAPRYLPIALRGGGGVGVVAKGSPTHWNDAARSLDEASAARLRALGQDLQPPPGASTTFLETAQRMAGLDLVITVDTAAAHLAGAIGAPCWVLLPDQGLDWRWNDGRRSDWYPDMRLFRRSPGQSWSDVLDAVEQALAARGPGEAPPRL
jgi:hypothetical protein